MCGIVGFIDKNKNIDIVNDMLKIQENPPAVDQSER